MLLEKLVPAASARPHMNGHDGLDTPTIYKTKFSATVDTECGVKRKQIQWAFHLRVSPEVT